MHQFVVFFLLSAVENREWNALMFQDSIETQSRGSTFTVRSILQPAAINDCSFLEIIHADQTHDSLNSKKMHCLDLLGPLQIE